MAILLSCRDIRKSFGELTVLKEINLDINMGDKIGLVGRNGAGKSTLARIISGCLDYDEGRLIFPNKGFRIGYLQQAGNSPEASLHTITSAEREEGKQFLQVASQLGINNVQSWEDIRLHAMSGGEKTKLALATVWSLNPEFLILDEPTNHLDYQGAEWLVKQLDVFSGAALIISHDRCFLDQTVNKIAEIDCGVIKLYGGNYSFFRAEKEKAYEAQLHAYHSQRKQQEQIEKNIRQLQEWSGKAHRESRKKGAADGKTMGGKEYFRKKAKKRDQAAKSKIKRLEKLYLEGIEKPEAEPNLRFSFHSGGKRGRRILAAENISKAYDELLLFQNSSFYVNRGEKVGIFGPNGCGKSTLLKMLMGQDKLDKGEIFLSPSARVAYIDQNIANASSATTIQTLSSLTNQEKTEAVTLFSCLGINYHQLGQRLEDLSWGERMKIEIARAILQNNDMLILDEPGNHLDLYSRESLERSLVNYQGTVLLVSHDRYLLNQVCNRMLLFDGNKVVRIESNLEDYLSKNSLENRKKQSTVDVGVDPEAEKLLIETRMSFLLGELSKYKPEEPEYLKLDQEFRELVVRKARY
ncbi:MAG: ribosomal protection-like ABC-F family protein [Syntrophomonas sp.]